MKNENIKIKCKIPAGQDETGSCGLWDLAGEIASIVAFYKNIDSPIYPMEWGQEEIYNFLRGYVN